MLPVRNFPMVPFTDLRRGLERLVDDLSQGFDVDALGMTPYRAYPALNMWQDGERLYMEAEVPGLNQADLEVHVVGNELMLKGRRIGRGGEKSAYQRQERSIGEFTRIVTLPVEVNPEKVEATLKDGVLTLTMPKAEQAKARKVLVKAV